MKITGSLLFLSTLRSGRGWILCAFQMLRECHLCGCISCQWLINCSGIVRLALEPGRVQAGRSPFTSNHTHTHTHLGPAGTHSNDYDPRKIHGPQSHPASSVLWGDLVHLKAFRVKFAVAWHVAIAMRSRMACWTHNGAGER